MTLRVVKMPSLADELDRLERRGRVVGDSEALPPDYTPGPGRPVVLSGRVKYCGGCKRELPVEHFNPNRDTADHLMPRCRECRSSASLESRARFLGYRADGQEPA